MINMALVFIPSLLRSLTQGEAQVEIPGKTVGDVIEGLELRFPGVRERLILDDRLLPSLSLAVDGRISRKGLRQPLDADSEVHFLPQISGG
jgi:molybdopterin synthase sulfur carrier subunit